MTPNSNPARAPLLKSTALFPGISPMLPGTTAITTPRGETKAVTGSTGIMQPRVMYLMLR